MCWTRQQERPAYTLKFGGITNSPARNHGHPLIHHLFRLFGEHCSVVSVWKVLLVVKIKGRVDRVTYSP